MENGTAPSFKEQMVIDAQQLCQELLNNDQQAIKNPLTARHYVYTSIKFWNFSDNLSLF